MARPTLLTPSDVQRQLATRAGWALLPSGDTIEKSYTFATFSEAFAFMTRAAMAADTLDHHPEWCNTYNRVVVRLTTHDAQPKSNRANGGLTALDFALADAFDAAL